MGSDYIHVKIGAAVGLVIIAMVALYNWAREEKAKTNNPDERFGWILLQVIAVMVSITFAGIMILLFAILEMLKSGVY